MGVTPLVFTGVSQYSDDFQTILNRAVSVATVPVRRMQNEQADLLEKKQLLTELSAAASELGSVIAEIGDIGKTRSLSVTTSNANRVAVTNTGATTAASYTVSDISSVAEAASETTSSGFATADQTPVSDTGAMQLAIGLRTFTFTLAEGKNNLNGVRDAINTLQAGVSATVLNTGAGAAPLYLLLAATAPGATTLQLRQTPDSAGSNILTATNQGADAIFKLNGLDVRNPDNVITGVIPGVTFTIVSQTSSGETVTLNLASDRGRLANALEALATAYNDVLTKVNAQIGKSAGLLSGDFLVREVHAGLRELTTCQGSGSIRSLADLGIELDDSGKMLFTSDKLYSLSDADLAAAFTLLGSSTSGLGGISQRFTELTDPLTGLIKTQQDQYDAADRRLSQQITALTDRVSVMQTELTRKLQAADALLASLSSQQQMLDASIQGLNLVLYGKKEI